MSIFDSLFGNKKKKERLEKERQEEQERNRLAEEKRRIAADNRRKEEERLAKQKDENSKKFQILDFYLDCSHWKRQNEILKKNPLALPIKRIDVDNDDDTVNAYDVRNLPMLILVDLNGKEIKRWKGVTESSEINNYLYDNGYAERPIAPASEQSSGSDFSDQIEQLDAKLAGQFVVESMSSDLGYKPRSKFSDEFSVSAFQEQYSHYCLMAKSNLVNDSMGMPNPLMAALKNHIKSYLSNPDNKSNQAMKYLYDLEDKDWLIQQLGMLTLHANMKHVQDIDQISNQEFHNALNPENVSLGLGLYVYFTLLANPKMGDKDFNELFVETWIEYFENVQARMIMFRMRGNSWKNDFAGVLLDD